MLLGRFLHLGHGFPLRKYWSNHRCTLRAKKSEAGIA
jgi:hypothetical protein